MRIAWIVLLVATAAPVASGHGALTINEFDTYALSDFEGQEDSFPWEGFEIWDVYAGDAYSLANASHGVYFKANFAGDGTVRPSGSQLWEIAFTFQVGEQGFERTIVHDGVDVASDFEELEWQIADGNVFQVRAWVPVEDWQDKAITDLVVVSSVDGEPRDIAPGGIYDPATGEEVPVHVPATPVFPEMGVGRVVDTVPLTGPEKYLDVTIVPAGNGTFDFDVVNPLAEQGQHFMVQADAPAAWSVAGVPNAMSLDGGASTAFQLRFTTASNGTIDPMPFDLLTDIGGRQTLYAYLGDGVHVVDDPALAKTTTLEAPSEDAPAHAVAWLVVTLAMVALRTRRRP